MRKFALATALCFSSVAALAQLTTPTGFLSATGTNSTLVRAGGTQVTALLVTTAVTSAFVLKLYDKATAPTCGTDTPKWRVIIPAPTGGGAVPLGLPASLEFINGLGFCITGGYPDNDTTAAVPGITVNFGIK